MKVNHAPSFRRSAILTAEEWKKTKWPQILQGQVHRQNGQPAGVRPSRNLLYPSCHDVLFLRYLKKKKNYGDSGWHKMELPVEFLEHQLLWTQEEI